VDFYNLDAGRPRSHFETWETTLPSEVLS
jgi:hypothetical protein